VRELQNVIEYAMSFETEPLICKECIEKRLNINDISLKVHIDKVNDGFSSLTLDSYLKMAEKKVILDRIKDYRTDSDFVYKICDNLNISKATFYRKLKEHSISIKDETV
jgi:transcriptional regulator with PAS, ATPase and Fis domain